MNKRVNILVNGKSLNDFNIEELEGVKLYHDGSDENGDDDSDDDTDEDDSEDDSEDGKKKPSMVNMTQEDFDKKIKSITRREAKKAEKAASKKLSDDEDYQNYLKHKDEQKTNDEKVKEQLAQKDEEIGRLSAIERENNIFKIEKQAIKLGCDPVFSDVIAEKIYPTLDEDDDVKEAIEEFLKDNPRFQKKDDSNDDSSDDSEDDSEDGDEDQSGKKKVKTGKKKNSGGAPTNATLDRMRKLAGVKAKG